MKTRKLGSSDLHLSLIGLGTWAIGGDWAYGWGAQDENDSIAAMHEALDLGVNWIDTAPAYGLGRAEEVVGKVIKGRRDKVIIATKCGLVSDGKRGVTSRLNRKSILSEVEDSLRRLGVERIDLYQIHWPNPPGDIEEAVRTLDELRKQGKIRYAGVSNFNVKQLEQVRGAGELVSLQPPYSMFDRWIEKEVLPWCAAHETGVLAYSPLQSGLLTGKVTKAWVDALPENDWRKTKSKFFQEPKLSENLNTVSKLQQLAHTLDLPLAELAVSWVLRRSEVTSAIVGARKKGQIRDVLGAAERRLSSESLSAIDLILD